VAGTTTLTLPAATDTLVGKATTDTLTNKTLTSPTITGGALNGTLGATTPSTGAFTTMSTTSFGVLGARTQIKGTNADITGATGSGVEIFGSSTPGILAYNRDGSAYLPLTVNALTVSLQVQGTTRGLFSSTGLAVTGSSLDLENNGDATTRSYSTNASNQAFVQAVNSVGTYIGLLQYGASKTPYGALGAGKGAVYSTDSVTIMSDTSTGIINFATGGNTERARIDSSGNLLVGHTAPGVTNTKSIIADLGADGYLIVNHSGAASGSGYQYFGYNGGVVGSITQNGTTGVLYNLTSDYRLKNEQEALTGAKDFIMALKPKKWQWWDGSGEGVGFVAHEFMEVAKYSGNGEKDAIDADGKPVYQSIQPSSSEVMANLVSFIQEQNQLITTLTARITALESA
jgi:hypothetical protein